MRNLTNTFRSSHHSIGFQTPPAVPGGGHVYLNKPHLLIERAELFCEQEIQNRSESLGGHDGLKIQSWWKAVHGIRCLTLTNFWPYYLYYNHKRTVSFCACVCVHVCPYWCTSAEFLSLVAEFPGLEGVCYDGVGLLHARWPTGDVTNAELVCQSAECDQWFLGTFIHSNKWSARQTMAFNQGENQPDARGKGVNMSVQSSFCSH